MKSKKLIDETNEGDLKKHSALTSYKLLNGKSLHLAASKAIQAIYSKEQMILKDNYRNAVLDNIRDLFSEQDIELIMNNLYTDKEIIFKEKLNIEKVPTLVKEILKYKICGTKWELLDKNTGKEKFNYIKNSLISKIMSNMFPIDDEVVIELENLNQYMLGYKPKNKNQLVFSEKSTLDLNSKENMNKLLVEIKDYCKEKTINNSVGLQQVDYTSLAKMIDVNTTRLKKDLKDAVNASFEFNYINKRNINIDAKTAMLASVKFRTGKDTTFLEYQIPIEILKLLLLPKTFADIKSKITFKFTNEYAYNLYSFLKDLLYKKEVTLTKQELFDFLNVPKKARESRYELQNRVLIPAISELETISDLSIKYELIPENKWREIKFIINENPKYVDETITIRKAKEPKKDYKDNERIVKFVEKAKRNIYVSRAVTKTFYNKVNSIYNEYGENFIVLILDTLYNSLNKNIETTLIQYINGIIKNLKEEARQSKKRLSKKMLEDTLKRKIKNVNDSIIPTFNTEQDVEIFFNNLLETLYKQEITKIESLKLRTELLKMGKSEKLINTILDKYFVIN